MKNNADYMKILKYICALTIILSMLLLPTNILSISQKTTNDSSITIPPVTLDAATQVQIGAEPPKLLYADESTVILDCCGIFIYDLKEQKITHSFDLSSLSKGPHSMISSMAASNGRHVIFTVHNDDTLTFEYYEYDRSIDKCYEITETQAADYRNSLYECYTPDFNDPMYDLSFGQIAQLTDNTFLYLTCEDWMLNHLAIVYVEDNQATTYPLFH